MLLCVFILVSGHSVVFIMINHSSCVIDSASFPLPEESVGLELLITFEKTSIEGLLMTLYRLILTRFIPPRFLLLIRTLFLEITILPLVLSLFAEVKGASNFPLVVGRTYLP